MGGQAGDGDSPARKSSERGERRASAEPRGPSDHLRAATRHCLAAVILQDKGKLKKGVKIAAEGGEDGGGEGKAKAARKKSVAHVLPGLAQQRKSVHITAERKKSLFVGMPGAGGEEAPPSPRMLRKKSTGEDEGRRRKPGAEEEVSPRQRKKSVFAGVTPSGEDEALAAGARAAQRKKSVVGSLGLGSKRSGLGRQASELEESPGPAPQRKKSIFAAAGAAAGEDSPRETGESDFVSVRKKVAPRNQIRLNVPAARLTFLKEHDFFQDTSASFRERLAPQMVKRSGELSDQEMVLRQGAEPVGAMGYLFLTAPDLSTKLDVLYDGKVIQQLGGSAVFGMEVVFGVTQTFMFSIRVPQSAMGGIWVIPLSVVHGLLQKEAYEEDAETLKDRAHEMITDLMHGYLLEPTTRIRLNLFENATHDFKHALVEAASVNFHAAGEVIRDEDFDQTTAVCIFRGDAKVVIDYGQFTTILSQGPGTNAWAAWWCILQVLGVTELSTGTITAITDCISLSLGVEALRELRRHFPDETRLFDKVGEQHLVQLQPFAFQLGDCMHLQSVDDDVLEALLAGATTRTCKAEDLIFDMGEESDDLFFIARGSVSIRQVLHSSSRVAGRASTGGAFRSEASDQEGGGRRHSALGVPKCATKVLGTLKEGSLFGELTCLGMRKQRVASAVCDTLVDLRIIPQKVVRDVASTDDVLLRSLLEVAQGHQFPLPPLTDAWKSLPFFGGLSPDFMACIAAQADRVNTMKHQLVFDETQDCEGLWVLLTGGVRAELDGLRGPSFTGPQVLGAVSVVQLGAKNFYSAKATSFCSFLFLSGVRLHALFRKFPQDEEVFREVAKEDFKELQKSWSSAREDDGGSGSELSSDEDADSANHLNEKDIAMFKDIMDRVIPGADGRFCDFLVHGLEKTTYFDGDEILREGDEGDFAIVIQRGKATVEVGGVRVGEVKEGSMAGEAVLVGSTARRTATVRAVGVVIAFTLAQSVVLGAFEEFPDERRRIEEVLKLREQANKVLTGADVPAPTSPSGYPDKDKAAGRRVSARSSVLRAGFEEAAAPRGPGRASLQWQMAKRMNHLSLASSAFSDGKGPKSDNSRTRRAIFASGGCEERDSDSGLSSDGSDRGPAGSVKRIVWKESEAEDGGDDEEDGSEDDSSALWRSGGPASSASSRRSRQGPLEWARRRAAALRSAAERQQQRQIKAGVLAPLVPPGQGYVPPAGGGGVVDPWAARRGAGAAGQLRLRRARGLYDRPVWHESFGL